VFSIARTLLAAGRGFVYAQDPEKSGSAAPLFRILFGRVLGLLAGSSLNHDAPQARNLSGYHHFIQQRRNKEPLCICL
jgi:hypothetical protein